MSDGAALPFVILIGLRGSGKTTVGGLLARRFGRVFVDLDDFTPRRLGCANVTDAWAMAGEAGFRAAETAALKDALAKAPPGTVISLGGGTPTAAGAGEVLKAARRDRVAKIAYLRNAPGTLRARLLGANNAHRPSLTGAGTLDEIEQVYSARDYRYRAIADAVIEADGLSIEQTADALTPLMG